MTVIYYQKITGIIQTIITVTYLTSIAHKPVLFRTQEIIKKKKLKPAYFT